MVNIEEEVFKRRKVDFKRLEAYGFVMVDEEYQYTKDFMRHFRAIITISLEGDIKGDIIDLKTECSYTGFRVESQVGEFVSKVRREYKETLEDIANKCCYKSNFLGDQANRIASKIREVYGDEPAFLWDKTPDAGVFKNRDNEKWYGIVMSIDWSKLDKNKEGKVEILNVKLDEEKIKKLLLKNGFYLAYHMNKKYWITIVLNETLTDEEILDLIAESYQYTVKSSWWIIPANPSFYDVVGAFSENEEITWKQSSDIKKGDIVCLYVGKPYSALLFKTEAIEVNIPYKYEDANLVMDRIMKIKLIKSYDKDDYPLEKLKDYGVRAVRGPRRMPKKLCEELRN